MDLSNMIKDIYEQIEEPNKGLPYEVFRFVSAITPMVNVDLLIIDDKNRILLAMRDDEFSGKVWHIPGGIIRFRETMEDRIQKTAQAEIGIKVLCDMSPIAVNEIFSSHEERGHFISFLFLCQLPNGFYIENQEVGKYDHGYLKWFAHCPDNFIECQRKAYIKYFKRSGD